MNGEDIRQTSLIATSFKSITFTLDPIASSLKTDAANGEGPRLRRASTDLTNIYDLTLLNKMLTAAGKASNHPHETSLCREHASRLELDASASGPRRKTRSVVSVANVTKTFGSGSQRVVTLEGVTLDVEQR